MADRLTESDKKKLKKRLKKKPGKMGNPAD